MTSRLSSLYNNCVNTLAIHFGRAGSDNWNGNNEPKIPQEVFEKTLISIIKMSTYGLPPPEPEPTEFESFLLTWTFKPNTVNALKAMCEVYPEINIYIILYGDDIKTCKEEIIESQVIFFKKVSEIYRSII